MNIEEIIKIEVCENLFFILYNNNENILKNFCNKNENKFFQNDEKIFENFKIFLDNQNSKQKIENMQKKSKRKGNKKLFRSKNRKR